MKLKKILSSLGIICLSALILPQNKAFAEENTGLITKCSLSCEEYENGKIKISAKTQASGVMSVIGFEDIIIQYSDDCINWQNEKYLGNILINNASQYCVDGITAEISGGHYYRVTCTHFAEGNTFTNADTFTQTAVHSSKYVFAERYETYSENLTTSGQVDILTTTAPETTTTTATTTTSTTVTTTATSTVSTVSTDTTSKTQSDTSAVLSTVSTTTTATANQNIKQENSSSKNSESDSTTKKYTIYEYFCDDSPLTGDNIPVSATAILVLSVISAIIAKRK